MKLVNLSRWANTTCQLLVITLCYQVVNCGELLSKWVGESTKNIEAIFEEAKHSDAILVFDEAEGLFGQRTEMRWQVASLHNLMNYSFLPLARQLIVTLMLMLVCYCTILRGSLGSLFSPPISWTTWTELSLGDSDLCYNFTFQTLNWEQDYGK